MPLPNWCKDKGDGSIDIDLDAAFTLYLAKLKMEPSALSLEIARRCIQADLYDLCVVEGIQHDHDKLLKPENPAYLLKSHTWDEAKEGGDVDRVAGRLWRGAYKTLDPIRPWTEILEAFVKRYAETGEVSAPKNAMARGAFKGYMEDTGAYREYSERRAKEASARQAEQPQAAPQPAG